MLLGQHALILCMRSLKSCGSRTISSSGPVFLNRTLWYGWKLALAFGVVGVVSLCYFNASRFTAHRSHDLTTFVDRAIPFVEWS